MAAALAILLILSADPPALVELTRGISAFQSGDDRAASAALGKAISLAPNGSASARAHLYLGLVALNRLDLAQCRAEFRESLALNPTIELPFDASPKAQVLFRQARAKLEQSPGSVAERTVAPSAAPPSIAQEPRSPPMAPTPPLVELSPVEPGRAPASVETTAPQTPAVERHLDPIPAIVLGGLSLVALGVGVGFGVAQGSTSALAAQSPGALSAWSFAHQYQTEGIVADGCFIGAAALGVSAGLWLLLARTRVPVEVTPLRQGGELSLSGSF